MQDIPGTTVASPPDAPTINQVSAPTPLAQALGAEPAALQELGGALSFSIFSDLSQEIGALTEGAAAFDLGYRGQVSVGSADRLRWLNGMLTNNIQGLAEGAGNYNFLLNAQGRIQGDCDTFRLPDHLLVLSDRSQIPALMVHFDHYIIMDDVAIEDVSASQTALGLAGPSAPEMLAAFGVKLRTASDGLWLTQTRISGVPVQLTGGYSTTSPRFELWCANENVRTLWDVLLGAGAIPCGLRATEALRVLEGIPRYGTDITGRDLPQETSQTRALHFSKGCYLGQEIVERIRSRGQVHRRITLFTLSSQPSSLPVELTAADENAPAGRITSTALYREVIYGLGIVRSEAVDRHPTLGYSGGIATLLTHPPLRRS